VNTARLASLALAVLLAVGGPPVAAQTGEDVLRFAQREPGASARMVGMAGAGVGGVADWGAATVNPAGLALVGGSHISGSLDLTSRQNEAVSDARYVTRANRLGPGHVAYVARVPAARGALVLGVGYHQTATLDRKLFFEQAGGGAGELYESGFLGELSGVASIEVAPRVYIGGSLNLNIGDYSFSEYAAGAARGTQATSLQSSLRGFGLRGGVVAEAVPGLRLGLALESPTWLYAEETFSEAQFAPELFNYAMQTPWRVAAGAVFDHDRILVSADLAFADWAQARLRPTPTFTDENRAIERSFREVIDVRLGAEYDFGLGAVRAGYAYGQDPLREEVAADRARHTVASGLSFYAYPGITLDFGVAFTESQDQFFPSDEAVRETLGALRVLAGVQVNLPAPATPRRR
jgi:hypothetical protein